MTFHLTDATIHTIYEVGVLIKNFTEENSETQKDLSISAATQLVIGITQLFLWQHQHSVLYTCLKR